MSYNVLLIFEDYTRDQHVVKPIVTKMLTDLGKPRANIQVCRVPHLQGISQCTNSNNLKKIIMLYQNKVDLFFFAC
ncbi:MAG: hypothetical protein KAX49_06215 [Halanaerobiales bacterium]|nr:hypothetical protein [Halanaerobiales bacterium]